MVIGTMINLNLNRSSKLTFEDDDKIEATWKQQF